MNRGKNYIKILILVLLVVAVAFAAGFFLSAKRSEGRKITADTLFQQMQTVSTMATLEYNYTNMGKFEDSADLNGWTIPLTKKSFILTYDGKITAGIDMQDVQVDVGKGTITVTLPPAKILSHEVNEKSIELYDESKNIFNHISIGDYAAFAAEQKRVMEKKTIEKGLLDSAQKRAKTVISQFLKTNAGLGDEYELKFKTEKNRGYAGEPEETESAA